jgi:hypothetical protein
MRAQSARAVVMACNLRPRVPSPAPMPTSRRFFPAAAAAVGGARAGHGGIATAARAGAAGAAAADGSCGVCRCPARIQRQRRRRCAFVWASCGAARGYMHNPNGPQASPPPYHSCHLLPLPLPTDHGAGDDDARGLPDLPGLPVPRLGLPVRPVPAAGERAGAGPDPPAGLRIQGLLLLPLLHGRGRRAGRRCAARRRGGSRARGCCCDGTGMGSSGS